MKLPWPQLAHAAPVRIERLQNTLLRRHLREELVPFVPYYRDACAAAGIQVRSLRGVPDLARVPLLERGALAGTTTEKERRRFEVRPSAAAMRTHWPFLRKLALVLGGKRAAGILQRSYTPIETLEIGCADTPDVAVSFSEYDLDLLTETALRGLEIAGLDLASLRLATRISPTNAFARLMSKALAERSSVTCVKEQETAATALLCDATWLTQAEAADWQALDALTHIICMCTQIDPGERARLEACAGVGSNARLTLAWQQPLLRSAWFECTPEAGLHISPDHALVQLNGGAAQNGARELIFTDLVGHATSFARLQTGSWISGELTRAACTHCGRSMPRLTGALGSSAPA